LVVYLLRDQARLATFAYSIDVTGRNLPRETSQTKWAFMTVVSRHEIPDHEEVMGCLQRFGFYVFDR